LNFLKFLAIILVGLFVSSCRNRSCTEKVIPRVDQKAQIACSEGQYIDVHEDFVICKCQPF